MYTSMVSRESVKCNNKDSPRQKRGGGNCQAQEGFHNRIYTGPWRQRKAYGLELKQQLKEGQGGRNRFRLEKGRRVAGRQAVGEHECHARELARATLEKHTL